MYLSDSGCFTVRILTKLHHFAIYFLHLSRFYGTFRENYLITGDASPFWVRGHKIGHHRLKLGLSGCRDPAAIPNMVGTTQKGEQTNWLGRIFRAVEGAGMLPPESTPIQAS